MGASPQRVLEEEEEEETLNNSRNGPMQQPFRTVAILAQGSRKP